LSGTENEYLPRDGDSAVCWERPGLILAMHHGPCSIFTYGPLAKRGEMNTLLTLF